MLAAPVAGAATHGKGGSGQSGDGQTVSQPAHGNSHGKNGNGGQGVSAQKNKGKGKGRAKGDQSGSAQAAGAKARGGDHAGTSAKVHHHGDSGAGNKAAQGTSSQGAKGQGGGAAPPGNNGTIKVDQAPLTSGAGANHANHSHVTCQLALSFFGFDSGTDYATVQFSAMPPSGSFTPVPVTSGPTAFSFVVSRRAGGGQLDTSQAYTLDVSGLKAQSKQGYHIRVVTHVTYSQGSDVKQKVFWYEPCASQATTPAYGQGAVSSESSSSSQTQVSGVEHSVEHHAMKAAILQSSSIPQFGRGSGPAEVTTRQHRSRTQLESSSGSGAFGRGSGPGNSGELASNSGQLPTGAGTDLGWFSPGRGSLASDGEALGGLALLGGGGLALRRLRRRRA